MSYAVNVISGFIQKNNDGTLDAVTIYARSGKRLGAYLTPAARGFIQITTGDIFTKSLDDFRIIVGDDTAYARLEKDELDPCFRPAPNFHPFEHIDPHYDMFSDDDETADHRFSESFLSPVYMQRLRLAEIEHRFPGGKDGTPGDKDVRDRLSAQSFVFHFNYKRLNTLRLATVNKAMLASSAVTLAAAAFLTGAAAMPNALTAPLDILLKALAPQTGGMAPVVMIVDAEPVRLVVVAAVVVLTATLSRSAIAAITRHFHTIHRGLFESFTSTSCARVSKAVTSRQDNLHYLERSMMEEIDRTREPAWASGELSQWVSRSRRWSKLVFWIHERMNAIEENMAANMKIIGLHYGGLRAIARLEALKMAGLYHAAALGLTVAWGIFVLTIARHGPADLAVMITAFLILIAGHVWRIARLHALVKAFEEPQSIQVVINLASTAYTKGYKDSALHDVIGAYLEREKQKMMMEEEKLRGK